jgi:hypothetical protein
MCNTNGLAAAHETEFGCPSQHMQHDARAACTQDNRRPSPRLGRFEQCPWYTASSVICRWMSQQPIVLDEDLGVPLTSPGTSRLAHTAVCLTLLSL